MQGPGTRPAPTTADPGRPRPHPQGHRLRRAAAVRRHAGRVCRGPRARPGPQRRLSGPQGRLRIRGLGSSHGTFIPGRVLGRAPMPKRPSRDEEPEDEGDREGWKAWIRDIAVAVIIMAVVLAAIFAYTQVWPPLVVVESSSMQHGDTTSFIGVIDTGDLVFVQAAPNRADVITYVQG